MKERLISMVAAISVAIGWALALVIVGMLTKTTVNLFMLGWNFISALT